MISERRRAQSGLVLACIMMFTMLAILFQGSRQPARVGQTKGLADVRGGANVAVDDSANVRFASLGK